MNRGPERGNARGPDDMEFVVSDRILERIRPGVELDEIDLEFLRIGVGRWMDRQLREIESGRRRKRKSNGLRHAVHGSNVAH